MQQLKLRSIGIAAHPRHNSQDHLGHKGAQQAHEGDPSQDGKHACRVLTRRLGEPPHNAAMLLALLQYIAFKQLCKYIATQIRLRLCNLAKHILQSLGLTKDAGAYWEHKQSKSAAIPGQFSEEIQRTTLSPSVCTQSHNAPHTEAPTCLLMLVGHARGGLRRAR